VLRRIFGPKRKEVTGGWRRLHNEEFHNLYTSLNVIKVIKWENLKERDHAEDLGINGKIVLECILGKYGGKVWPGYTLAHDKDQWRDLVNTVMNLRVP